MRIAVAFAAFVVLPLGGLVVTDAANAQVHCRCECQVYVIPYRNGFIRRRICRRYCWREAPRYAQPPPFRYFPPQPTYRPPAKQYAAPYSPTPATFPSFSFPSVPKPPPELLAIFLLCAAGVLVSRLIRHIAAVIAQRRADRVERRALSARELAKRLQADARAADAIIAAYAREAYRRGGSL